MATNTDPQATTAAATALAPVERPIERAPIPVRLGIVPASLDEAWRLAQVFAKSTLVPPDFQGKTENVLVAMQYGAEIGLAPMQALQSIAVINGRPSVWGDGFLAVIANSPKCRDREEYYEVAVPVDGKRWIGERRDGLNPEDWKRDDTAAVCVFWRTDSEKPFVARFTVGQARKAGLLAKKGPWQDYPDRMLKMRARSWAGRDAFPDVLRGLTTIEEAGDVPVAVMDMAPVVREVRRVSETAPTPTPAAAPAMPPTTPVVLDPAEVIKVDQFLGGYTVTLRGGMQVDVTDSADAIELEKFVGTSHKVRVTATRADGGSLLLHAFQIAD